MKRLLFVCALGVVLSLHFSPASSGQVPERINYQGRLIDGTSLANGRVSLVLRVYDSATAGTLQFVDSNDVLVVDGIYSTQLGAHPLFGTLTNALTGVEAWIEVEINGTKLSPREELLAVPYALVDRSGDLASNVWASADSTTNYLRRSDSKNPISIQYANQIPVYFTTIQEGFLAISNNCYVEIYEGTHSVTGGMPGGYTQESAQNAGLYLISKENVTISGMGMPTIMADTPGDVLALYGCRNITIEGVRFSGNGPNVLPNADVCALVDLMGTNEHTTFQNCQFVNFPSHGISQLPGPKFSLFTRVSNCLFTNGGNRAHSTLGTDGASVSGIGPYAVIENNIMSDVLRGAEVEGSDWAIKGVRISGNTIRYWRDAVVVYPSDHQQTNMTDGVIENNIIIGLDSFAGMTTNTMPGPGIVIEGGERWRIANNTICNFGPAGITAWSFVAGLNDLQIIGNMIASNRPGYPTGHTINGIYAADGGYGSTNIIVQANNVSGCDGTGIWLSGTETKAMQNVVRNCQYAGILVQNEGKNEQVFLEGNIEYDNANGLIIAAGVTGTVVRSNYAYDNWGSDFIDAGEATVVRGWVNASGGTNRIAIGNGVTNRIDSSTAIRGDLYLDGGKRVYTNAAFGGTNWGVKAFTIDHPLDPQNKVLRHYCVEGPEVWDIYGGNALLKNGEATIDLPAYYSTLNLAGSEIYTLTPVGDLALVCVKEKVKDNRFVIKGDKDIEVSWTVKARRNDPAAVADLKQRPVEQLKSELKPGQIPAENQAVNTTAVSQ